MIALTLVLALYAPPQEKESVLEKLEAEVAAVVDAVRPSVVKVTASFQVEASVPPDTLTFSGIVFSKDGFIVTDASGVTAAGEIRVAVGERTFKAALVASDRRTGVAVLKIPAEGLTPAAFADGSLKSGGTAIAVGNALGLSGTSSIGRVNGLGRTVVAGGRKYEGMIQISAPLSPGDCGGFVADARGRLIGLVHSAYTGETEEGKGAGLLHLFQKNARDLAPARENAVAFATPAAWVRFSAERIIRHGRMVRGWLGLSARPLEPEARTRLGLAADQGAEIAGVEEGGPAAAAGLKALDVLVEVDATPVKELEELRWKVARSEPGSRLKVAYLRSRERREVEVEVRVDPQK